MRRSVTRASSVFVAVLVFALLLGTPPAPAQAGSSAAVNPTGSTYFPLTPTRLLDSRSGLGLSGAFRSHVARTFQVSGGSVPANAVAVTGNLTVVGQTSAGYLFIGPVAANDPTSSMLNFPAGDVRANAVVVALSSSGSLSVTFAGSSLSQTAQVLFDVTGYFVPDTSGSTYFPLTPTRLLDSRSGLGLSGAFRSHVARTFQVSGGSVPANAVAVTGNLTVVGQTSAGYLFIGPVAANDPTSSMLNFPAGDVRANAVVVALSSSGSLSVTFAGSSLSQTAQVLFDVTGYFVPDTSGSTYFPLTPTRLLDSRSGLGLSGAFRSHVARTFQVSGGSVPANAVAVTGNLTVVGQTSAGYLFIGPVAANDPTSSMLNFPAGDVRANAVVVALSSSGSLSVTFAGSSLSQTAQVLFDVTGYFASASGPQPAGQYYVATSGHNTGSGSITDPWLTLQHAADSAPSGATINVRGGTYGPFSITRSGLTFQSYTGESAVIKGAASAFDAVHIEGVTSATLSNLTVTGNVVQYGSGIAVRSSSGVTLSHLTVHDNTSYGIRTNDSSVLIEQSAIYLNRTGIEVARSGTVTIRNNEIHDNNKWIDPGVGAQGISFFYTTGSVTAANNRIWGNHTLAGDPLGQEGKAFEIYAARNVTMTGNVVYDNRQVLESGTDSSHTPCSNLTFTGNLAYRSGSDTQMGLILRCFDHSLVAGNTFVGLDTFAFDVSSNLGTYGGSIEGLRILDNLVAKGRTYSIDNAIPSSVVMDYNLAYTTASATAEFGTYDAWVFGHDQTTDRAVFRGWTGQAGHDIWGLDPLLDSNFCPKAGSPAINAGISVGRPYSGPAPDIGYCEVG